MDLSDLFELLEKQFNRSKSSDIEVAARRIGSLQMQGYEFQDEISKATGMATLINAEGDVYLVTREAMEAHNPENLTVTIVEGEMYLELVAADDSVHKFKGQLSESTKNFNKYKVGDRIDYKAWAEDVLPKEQYELAGKINERGIELMELGYELHDENTDETGHFIFHHPDTQDTIALGVHGCEHPMGKVNMKTTKLVFTKDPEDTGGRLVRNPFYRGPAGEA